MKFSERLKRLNAQTRWMIIVIALLLLMIITRWGYISHTAGTAFSERFKAPSAQCDTLHTPSATE